MHDDNPHLRSVLRTASHEQVTADDESGLPTLRDGEYLPYGRPSNKPIHALHFVDCRGDVRSYQYVHLDSDSRFEANRITLRFLGMEPTQVTIHGRNLRRLYDYIHSHRIGWVMMAASDFAKDGEPVVTNVLFAVINTAEVSG